MLGGVPWHALASHLPLALMALLVLLDGLASWKQSLRGLQAYAYQVQMFIVGLTYLAIYTGEQRRNAVLPSITDPQAIETLQAHMQLGYMMLVVSLVVYAMRAMWLAHQPDPGGKGPLFVRKVQAGLPTGLVQAMLLLNLALLGLAAGTGHLGGQMIYLFGTAGK